MHRDIKPSNIIVDAAGRLRILDFGLAYLEELGTLTLTGEVVGTPLYMSPEQARRESVAVDHRTDVYSLGATLYEVLTLAPPFRGKDRHDTLRQILERDPPPVRPSAPRTPVDLETIVLKCLRKEREHRYGSAQALAQDLERFVLGEPIEARREGAWERLRRRLRRHRVRFAVGIGFAVLLALAGALAWRGERAEREAARERYRPAVLELAARLTAGEFSLAASAASRAQSVQLPPGPLAPLSPKELRRLFEGGALRSLREAAERLERLTQELPGERDGHYHLARAHRLLGREDLARAAAGKALAIDPAFVPGTELMREIAGPARSGTGGAAASEPSPDAAEWARLWLRARRGRGSGVSRADWPAAFEAYDGLLRIAKAAGEPYAGLLLEAYLGRGVARLGLEAFDGAIEDFAVALEKAPTSLEPVLLLGKAYLLADKQGKTARTDRARSIFEALFRDAPADRREEAAIWIALVHVSLLDYQGALEWAARIESRGPGARLRSYLHLELEDWGEAVASGREAVAATPGDLTARLLLASALLGRASRRGTAGCEERLELLEEVKSLTESEPENQHAAFLLRMALETVRLVLGTQSEARSFAMTKPTRCLEALVAMAMVLGARPLPAEEQVIRDDFVEDPVWDDGQPLTWEIAGCCPARVVARPDEGICLTAATDRIGGLASQEVFQGDVTIRMRVRLPLGTGGEGHGIAISLHFDPFNPSGYHAAIRQDRSALLMRFDSGNVGFRFDQLSAIDFDPTAQDAIVELRTVGPAVQLRVWAADGEATPPPPLDPLLSANDTKYRAGSVMASVGWLIPDACVRWAEVTVTPPCDTHCEGMEIAPISDAGNNVRVTAQASDDGGDPILYTFTARRGLSFTKTIGPQSEPLADFDLPAGTYMITVSVSDGTSCSPPAEDADCSQSYLVPEPPPASLQLPGDCNQDRKLDISDALCVFGFLFLGGPTRLPCGDGSPSAAGNIALQDWQPDGRIDLSDGIGLLQFLFSGGEPHPLGSECAGIPECPQTCEE